MFDTSAFSIIRALNRPGRLAHRWSSPVSGAQPSRTPGTLWQLAGRRPGLLMPAFAGGRLQALPDHTEPGHSMAALPPARPERPWHIPVLLDEVVSALCPGPGKLFFDGTLGGGGHTEALLKAGADVVGFDQDPDALEQASARLEGYGGRFVPIQANFADFPQIFTEAGLGPKFDGILLDIGVSSHQIDCRERGFSFQADGPLDMRMSPENPVTAATIVNEYAAVELERILFTLGEEPAARRIVREIVKRRAVEPFVTTLDLVRAIEAVSPRRGKTSPATKTFQALRIAVNRELEVLETALAAAHHWLKPGGRLAVITFHSLEDRICKHHLRHHSQPEIDRPEWPAARPNPDCYYRLVHRKAVEASAAELAANPRARSARLRVAERLPFSPLTARTR